MRGDEGFPVRLRFTRLGKVRFVSHRDVARAFERAFRVHRLPLAFTQGFSPRPKVSFGLALGVGHESRAEYLDVELVEAVDTDALAGRISHDLPDGIDVTGTSVLEARAPSLQESVRSVELELRLGDLDTTVLTGAVQRASAAETLPVTTTRKGHRVVEDLRPALRTVEVRADEHGRAVVHAHIDTQPRGLRPADLLVAIRDLAGAPPGGGGDRVLRTHQWIERDGARLEPLEADHATRTATRLRVTSKGLSDERRDHAGGPGLRPDDPDTGEPRARRIA